MFLKHHLLADVTLFVLSVHGLPSALKDSRAVNVFQPVSLRFDRRAFNIFERQYVPSDCSVGVACLSSAACCDSFDSCCGNNCCAPGFQCVNAIVGSGLACCDGNSIVDGSCGASSSGNVSAYEPTLFSVSLGSEWLTWAFCYSHALLATHYAKTSMDVVHLATFVILTTLGPVDALCQHRPQPRHHSSQLPNPSSLQLHRLL